MNKKQTNFFNTLKKSLASETPFVFFNKPNSAVVTSYIQKTKDLYCLKSYSQSGFVFAGFDDNSSKKIIFPLNKCKKDTINYKFLDKDFELSNSNTFKIVHHSKEKESYKNLISTTINHINKTNLNKIVISRKEVLQLDKINIVAIYESMLNSYKNAFVYCWYHPVIGLWMGASPERFLNIENNKFKTMALAGTQEFKGTLNVNWGKKEIEEQQFVTDFIVNSVNAVFNKIEVSNPYTVQAGNLLHLRTDIFAAKVSSSSIEKLVKKLHPTPAVCGLPKEKAKAFILKNEGYKRSYYTGFLGELNMGENTNFYVNLRCMEIENNYVSIYVGGGITSQSNPEDEWEETVSKTSVMKKVIM